MKDVSPLQRAVEALQGIPNPFEAATALLFLVALADADRSRVFPPAAAHWPDLGTAPTGRGVNAAFRALESACPAHLEGALVHAALDTVTADTVATAAGHIARFLAQTPERDLFGQATMDAQSLSAQQRAGAFFTPKAVALTVAGFAGVEPGEWVLEPACGTGALLLAAIAAAVAAYGPVVAQSITYIGVELDPRSARLARMNMVLAGAADQSHIFCGDALARQITTHHPAGGDALYTVQFDVIAANPPFGKTTAVRGLRRQEPFVIPERLMNRPVAVAAAAGGVPAPAPAAGPPEPRLLPREGQQLAFDLKEMESAA